MDASVAEPATAGAGEGPHLELDGFGGPLASLLSLAREHAIDLAGFPLADCIRQLIPVLEQTGPVPPLTQRADWLVMAAWLVLLCSRLLLPAANPAEAAEETGDGSAARPLACIAGGTGARHLARPAATTGDRRVRARPAGTGRD